MKTCRKCGELFEGKACKDCARRRSAAFYIAHKEEVIKRSAEWKKSNPEKAKEIKNRFRSKKGMREKEMAYSMEWNKKHPDRVRANGAKWRSTRRLEACERSRKNYKENAEERKKYAKQWRADHPEQKRIQHQNRRARTDGGRLSSDLLGKLFKLQRGKCAVCHEPIAGRERLDHIVPLALEGANEDWNIQLLCPPCNGRKHAKHPIDFMQSMGFLL